MSFRVRMQICLSPEKYAMKLRPYFVRFMDTRGEQRHVPVESYSYAHDCVLSVVFAHDEKEASAAQSPVVCFDPDDTGVNHESSNSIESSVCIYTADEYTRMFQRVADVRDKLAEAFPGCRQLDMGFMNDRLLIVFELKGFFSVAVSSADDMPMFVWDRRGLKPLNRANMRLGMGFVVQMWMAGGGLDTFWYEHSGNVRAFPSVEAMVRAADDGFRTQRIHPEVHLHCDQVLAGCDLFRAQITHLRTVFPYVRVAPYTKGSHCVKVYIDLQWRCQVRLRSDGAWRIVRMDPDPVLENMDTGYLEEMESKADNALRVSAHFIRTGRVCACCSITLPTKMRRCPCKGAYYCGSECQRAHWQAHRLVCGCKK